ncbi:PilZ domain-containing protein [Oleisolibacter albus]|uniref:PilZ domain-containing protein n=1 Tax=Oleisolibacter albus TaxID=2171757 RepID=UPI000DF1545B|nr:PilZ domain-containing protein [Oleisolibacter albus]
MRAGPEPSLNRSAALPDLPVPGGEAASSAGWLARLFGRDRRRHGRTRPLDARVQIGPLSLSVVDVSVTGLKIAGYRGTLAIQDRFDLDLSLVNGPSRLDLHSEAIVVWRTGDRMGVAFYGLGPADRETLSTFLGETV